MKAEDLAYIAGFFDGEGCATLIHGGGTKRNCVQKRVCMSNINKDILLQIQRILGFGSIYEKKRDNPKHKMLYDLVILTDQVPVFLALILPYVRLKATGRNSTGIFNRASRLYGNGSRALLPEYEG